MIIVGLYLQEETWTDIPSTGLRILKLFTLLERDTTATSRAPVSNVTRASFLSDVTNVLRLEAPIQALMLHSPISKDTIDLGQWGIDVHHPFLINKTFPSSVCEFLSQCPFFCFLATVTTLTTYHTTGRHIPDDLGSSSTPLWEPQIHYWRVFLGGSGGGLHRPRRENSMYRFKYGTHGSTCIPKFPDFRKSIALLI